MNNRLVGFGLGVVVLGGLMGMAGLSRAGFSGTDIPLDGSQMRLIDSPRPQGRRSLVGFIDSDVALAMVDPTISGATATIGRPGGDSVAVLELPASGWSRTGNTARTDFKFKSRTGPVYAARLVDGRSVRFSARGPGAYALGGTPQGAVAVIVEVGPVRFCSLFGGAIAADNGQTFLARRAPAPAGCPVLGTGTTTTTTTESTTSTTESTTTTESSTTTVTTTSSTTTTTLPVLACPCWAGATLASLVAAVQAQCPYQTRSLTQVGCRMARADGLHLLIGEDGFCLNQAFSPDNGGVSLELSASESQVCYAECGAVFVSVSDDCP